MAYLIRRVGKRQWLQYVDDAGPQFTPFRDGAICFELRAWAEDVARLLEELTPGLRLVAVKV